MLYAFVLFLAISLVGVIGSKCPLPKSYLKDLDWTATKAACTAVGNGKDTGLCDRCFSAFVSAQNSQLIQYIDISQVLLLGPEKTMENLTKECGRTVQRILKKKLPKSERKKAKNVNRCFKIPLSKLPNTQKTVQGAIAGLG
jgi:hypothetical protein